MIIIPNSKKWLKKKQTQRRHPHGTQVHEKMLHISNHREIQLKGIIRSHLTLVRTLIINKKCFGKNVDEKEPMYTVSVYIN